MNTKKQIKEYMKNVEWEEIYPENSTYVIETIMSRFGCNESKATKIVYEMFQEIDAENN